MTKPTSKSAPQTWDLRVRSRYTDDGTIQPGELEKYLAALPDVEEASEPIGIAQPGLDEDEDEETETETETEEAAPEPAVS